MYFPEILIEDYFQSISYMIDLQDREPNVCRVVANEDVELDIK